MKLKIKEWILGKEIRLRSIRYGIAKGLTLEIDPLNKSQRIYGLDEREIQQYFKTFAKDSDIFVDVGSSDGYYSLIYRKINAVGEIYSCDINPGFFSQQRANFGANDFVIDSRFHIISRLIGSKDSDTTIKVDSLISHHPKAMPFLKIDVDGGELEVLQGAVECLHNFSCRIIVETHSIELERDCITLLGDLGYKVKIINNAWWRKFVPEKRVIPHNRWFVAGKSI